MSFKQKSYRLAVKGSVFAAVMFAALTLLTVYTANIIPVGRLAVYCVASIFIYGTMAERYFLGAIASFFAVLFLGYLLSPDKAGMVPYAALFGHYGIFRFIADQAERRAVAYFLKWIYYNGGMAVIYFFGGGWLLQNIPWEFSPLILLLLCQGVFLLYELFFSAVTKPYLERGRAWLVGRRYSG